MFVKKLRYMKIILTTLLVSILFFSCTKTGPQGPPAPAGTNGTNGTNAIQSTQIFTVASTAWRNDGGDGRVALYDNQITGSTNALTYLSTDSVKWQNYSGVLGRQCYNILSNTYCFILKWSF